MALRPVYRWTRDLHLYLGLFVSPFVLLFAISVLLLNHVWLPWGGLGEVPPETRRLTIALAHQENNLELAKQIQRQIGIAGEIDFISRDVNADRVSFPITRPGYRTTVRVDLSSGATQLEEQRTGIWDAVNYLHKMPGPHNASVRGNWIFTRIWGWLADWTVYLLLFSTASGVYLWTVLKAERRAGLFFLGAGAVFFLALVFALTG